MGHSLPEVSFLCLMMDLLISILAVLAGIIGIAGSILPVQERELDLGIVYGGDYECAVKIGCDDM